MKLRSITGRIPFMAAPTPAATIAASEIEPAGGLEGAAQPLDGVLRGPPVLDLLVLAVVRDLARVVAPVAVGDRLDERGAVTAGGPLARLARCPVDGANVLAVDLNGRQAEPGCAPRDRVVERGRASDEGLDRVLVVLAERDQRQALDRCEVD